MFTGKVLRAALDKFIARRGMGKVAPNGEFLNIICLENKLIGVRE